MPRPAGCSSVLAAGVAVLATGGSLSPHVCALRSCRAPSVLEGGVQGCLQPRFRCGQEGPVVEAARDPTRWPGHAESPSVLVADRVRRVTCPQVSGPGALRPCSARYLHRRPPATRPRFSVALALTPSTLCSRCARPSPAARWAWVFCAVEDSWPPFA